MNTEIGRIAKMLSNNEDEDTPLQKKLAQLSKFLGYLTLGIVVLMFGVSLIYEGVSGTIGTDWSNALLDAVGLAVAAIPEGLPAVVTIVLALGMKEVKIKEDRIAVEIRLNEETGAGERRKARWAEENHPSDRKPALPQEYLTESALWAQSIALWLSNNVESPKASAVANLAAGVCGRIAEKAKKGAYRGEDDQELSDLVRMIGMFVGEDYKSFANVLALQEKISSWTGEINTIGEEDIKPCLEEGGK